jgi:hypothetical protein
MIFSCLLRRLFLLLLFALVSVSPGNAVAQCPGGKPPNRDGSCGKPQEKSQPNANAAKPPKSSGVSKSSGDAKSSGGACSISVRVVRQGGEPVSAVKLALDGSSQSAGVTDIVGSYKFTKLPCKRKYKVTPTHPGLTFNLASITIANLRKNDSALFIAVTREATVSRKGTRKDPGPCNPAPKTLPTIKFDEPVTGKLSPQTSWCEDRAKGYFLAYQLEGAIGGDIVQFDLQSDGANGANGANGADGANRADGADGAGRADGADGQSSDLLVQVIDQAGNEIAPEGESDGPSGRQVTLPAAGDYTLRVISKSDRPSDYRLSVTRKGLTDEGYRGQLDRALAAIAEPDRPTFYGSLNLHLERLKSFSFTDGKGLENKINAATAILEHLRDLSPNKPDAYSMLAAIQLYYRKDTASSRDLATKALLLGGEARFRVNFGEKLDRDQRRITDSNFPCWLIIRKGKISCEGFRQNEGEVFNSKPELIGKKSLDINPTYTFGLMIYGEAKKASGNDKREGDLYEIGSYYFLPMSALDLDARIPLTEVATIKTFIKQFVQVREENKKQSK